MIVIDTSVWVDHTRREVPWLSRLLQHDEAGLHEFVEGELLLGSLRDRGAYGEFLAGISRVDTAPNGFVLRIIEDYRLYGTGIGYVDTHVLASTLLTEDATLWTRDRRLNAAAERMGIRAEAQ